MGKTTNLNWLALGFQGPINSRTKPWFCPCNIYHLNRPQLQPRKSSRDYPGKKQWKNGENVAQTNAHPSAGVIILPNQIMHYYKGNLSKNTIYLHCLIPLKWIIWWLQFCIYGRSQFVFWIFCVTLLWWPTRIRSTPRPAPSSTFFLLSLKLMKKVSSSTILTPPTIGTIWLISLC